MHFALTDRGTVGNGTSSHPSGHNLEPSLTAMFFLGATSNGIEFPLDLYLTALKATQRSVSLSRSISPEIGRFETIDAVMSFCD